jgi:general secretion pathway protein C
VVIASIVPIVVPDWPGSCCPARFEVERLLTKHMWLLDAAVVAICAGILGAAASNLVAYRFSEVAPPRAVAWVANPIPQPGIRSKKPDAILRRNIFCSTCPPIRLDGEPEPEPLPDTVTSEPQATQLPLRLLAVMYHPSTKEQEWNMAVIRDGEQKIVGAFRAGEKIHGATLLSVRDTRVFLDNAGTTEFIDLLAPPKAAPPISPRRSPPLPARSNDAFSQELDRGIKRLGERRYEIQRGTLNSVLGNLALLSRSARIIPEVRAGKAAGFRLLAVRPDGPFAKIGLQNGDVVASINGLEMSSPEKALEVYGKLKSASHLELGLERNGQKVSSEYTIR